MNSSAMTPQFVIMVGVSPPKIEELIKKSAENENIDIESVPDIDSCIALLETRKCRVGIVDIDSEVVLSELEKLQSSSLSTLIFLHSYDVVPQCAIFQKTFYIKKPFMIMVATKLLLKVLGRVRIGNFAGELFI